MKPLKYVPGRDSKHTDMMIILRFHQYLLSQLLPMQQQGQRTGKKNSKNPKMTFEICCKEKKQNKRQAQNVRLPVI